MIQLNGIWQVFLGGMLGVVLVELFQLAAWKQTGKLTQKYGEPLYWITTVALLLASGALTVLNGTQDVGLLQAVQLGINAPALFAGYASASKHTRERRQQQAGFMATRQEKPPGAWSRLVSARAW